MDRVLWRLPFGVDARGNIDIGRSWGAHEYPGTESSHMLGTIHTDPAADGYREGAVTMSKQNGDSGAIPSVERNEDGDLMVRADGRLYPAVEQYETGDGVTGVSRCPYGCEAESHTHSMEPGLMGHRVSHCYPEKAEDDRGYFLLRVQENLLGLPYRWWENTRDDIRRGFDPLYMAFNLGFGGPDAQAVDGPGLFSSEVL